MTRLPYSTTARNAAICFVRKVCKMPLLTVYGEFRVPVDFIQANSFVQFHLRWDRTRITWRQKRKLKYTAAKNRININECVIVMATGWLSAVRLLEGDSYSYSKVSCDIKPVMYLRLVTSSTRSGTLPQQPLNTFKVLSLVKSHLNLSTTWSLT